MVRRVSSQSRRAALPSGDSGVFVQAAVAEILSTRWLISSRNVFLTVPETEKSKRKALLADSVSGEVLFSGS